MRSDSARIIGLPVVLWAVLTLTVLVSVEPAAGTGEVITDAGASSAKSGGTGGYPSVLTGPASAPMSASGKQRLMADTNGTAEIGLNSATGFAGFVRLAPGSLQFSVDSDASLVDKADAFLRQYGGVFGAGDTAAELAFSDLSADAGGAVHLSYQQYYEGVPAFAGVLRVHFDGAGELRSINGAFLPDVSLKTTASLSAEAASYVAADTVRAQMGQTDLSSDLAAANARLFVYRTGLAQGIPGDNHLVFEVEVSDAAMAIREFVYVDAHSGRVVDQITGIFEARHRETWDAGNDIAGGPGSVLCRAEGDPVSGLEACDEAHDYAGDSYDYYWYGFGRDSLDDEGMLLLSYYAVCPGGPTGCPWHSASWNGQYTSYGTTPNGRPWTADDTVAHELTHGVTDFTSNLIYQWQPGAISEALSDIFGEIVDQVNGSGLDVPNNSRTDYLPNSTGTFPTAPHCLAPFGSDDNYAYSNVRYLQGEQDYLVRDMWAPSCFGDPDHVTHPNYECTAIDGGGVHINSGVVNHHYALLSDGGSFNGQTISGLGHVKAGAIYYQAQTNYLTPSSDFADLANSLLTSCSDLININLPNPLDGSPSGEVIGSADCETVTKASLAVELGADAAALCGWEPLLDPDAPALCENVGTVNSISLTEWESGLGGWGVGTRDVANPVTFDTPDWAVETSLPAGRPGSAAFVEDNPSYGNCGDDTEAGVLYLESPVIGLPGTAIVPRIAIDHWVATEAGWDGGNFKIRVNGGPWTLIPVDKFDFNRYNATLSPAPGNDNPLAAEEAFSGTDEGSVTGSWGQSQLNLLGLAEGGDEIQLRVEMGLDGCNGAVGWWIDDVEVYSCSGEVPGAMCGNGRLDSGESCDDGNSANGDGCSSTCQIETGYYCTVPDEISANRWTKTAGDNGYAPGTEGESGRPSECVQVGLCSSPELEIPDGNPAGISDSLVISTTGLVGDLSVYVGVTHTWVGDLVFSLTHEDSGTSATFIDRPGVPDSTFGCSGDNIEAVIDDEGAFGLVEEVCNDLEPAISGILMPWPEPLGVFVGDAKAGTWTLTVSDHAGPDVGTINQWCVAASVEDPTDVHLATVEGEFAKAANATTWLTVGALVIASLGLVVIVRKSAS